MSVNHSSRSGGKIGISFQFSLTWQYVVFSLELPHRGDSNEYTQHTIFNKKITLNLPLCDFFKRLENEFEMAVADEPSVLEPLKFYCRPHFGNTLSFGRAA